eukprot:COSAG01_NODE_2426_length_7722_cov_2.700905_14_plen_67_part_00
MVGNDAAEKLSIASGARPSARVLRASSFTPQPCWAVVFSFRHQLRGRRPRVSSVMNISSDRMSQVG